MLRTVLISLATWLVIAVALIGAFEVVGLVAGTPWGESRTP